MTGKVLVYRIIPESYSDTSYYAVKLVLYNETSVMALSKGDYYNSFSGYLISYDPDSNTLTISGLVYNLDCNDLIGYANATEGALADDIFIIFDLSPILPRTLIDNIQNIANIGYINIVIKYLKGI